MSEDRDADKKVKFAPTPHVGIPQRAVSLDQIKSLFVASGKTAEQIAEDTFLPVAKITKLVEEHKLVELRQIYVREGLSKIQNIQLTQAQKLMDLELDFKKLRIIQLERQLEEFLAYYARHGDFCKRHPISGEILRDTNGIAMQISVPNVSREISQLKESVTLSEGLKKLLSQIDSIINPPLPDAPETSGDDDAIDMEQLDGLFKKNP